MTDLRCDHSKRAIEPAEAFRPHLPLELAVWRLSSLSESVLRRISLFLIFGGLIETARASSRFLFVAQLVSARLLGAL